MRVYLSGEIHTDWRNKIIEGAKDLKLIFDGPVTDHPLVTIVEPKYWEKKIINIGMTTKEQC